MTGEIKASTHTSYSLEAGVFNMNVYGKTANLRRTDRSYQYGEWLSFETKQEVLQLIGLLNAAKDRMN